MVQRKVKAALNKMTPENFEKISEQILTIAGQSKNEQDGRTLRQVIQLTFEKATDEAHWASMYAKFCKRMLETMSPEIRDENILDKQGNVVSGGALFRKYLLNRCQEEFERGWKVDLPEQKEGKAGEAALLSEEYYIAAAAKRRGLGLVQFIGELYKLGMLTERIMHECVRKLLEFTGMPDEAEIESLTKLLKTIGGNLDSTDKGRAFMEAYFQRIDGIVHLDNLPSRLMFMLMDIIDLRRAGWVSKETNKGPKTLEEVRAEVCLSHAPSQAALGLTYDNRLRQRLHKRRPRAPAATSAVPQAAGRWVVVAIRGTSRTTTRSPTKSAWTISGVSRDPRAAHRARTRRRSARRPCSTLGATVAVAWVAPVVLSVVPVRTPVLPHAPERRPPATATRLPIPMHLGTYPCSVFLEPLIVANHRGRLLADTGDHPGSPPSAHASPALSKATLDTVAAGDKKE
jgi:translation initiation factor 4G